MDDDIEIFNVSTYSRQGSIHHWSIADSYRPCQGRITGAPEGIKPEDPTIAELLKEFGYATGQFGKNHLGDRDAMFPI